MKLSAAPSRPQFTVKPKLNGAINVNVDVLGLVGDGRFRRDPSFVVFVFPSQDFDHGGLPGAVCTDHPHHFAPMDRPF